MFLNDFLLLYPHLLTILLTYCHFLDDSKPIIAVYTRFKNLSPNTRPLLYNSTRVLANGLDNTNTSNSTKTSKIKLKNNYWALALCSRNLLLVLFIANLSNYSLVQCLMSLIVNVGFFIATLVWRFFDLRVKRNLVRISEGLHAIIPIFFLMYAINDMIAENNKVLLSQNAKDGIGWVIIVLISITLLLTVAFQMIDSWYALKSLIQASWQMLKKFAYYVTGLDSWMTKPRKKPAPASKTVQSKEVDDSESELRQQATSKTVENESPRKNLIQQQSSPPKRKTYLENMLENSPDVNANDITDFANASMLVLNQQPPSIISLEGSLTTIQAENNVKERSQTGLKYLQEKYGSYLQERGSKSKSRRR